MNATATPAHQPIRMGGWANLGFWLIVLGGGAASAFLAIKGEAAGFTGPTLYLAEGALMLILTAVTTLGARGRGFIFRFIGFVLLALVAVAVLALANLIGSMAGAQFAGRALPIPVLF